MKNIEEIKKDIEYWENEVQEALKENNTMKAITCGVLVNNLSKKYREKIDISNIEDDIKILKDKDCLWIYSEDDILKAQEHILSERDQDKARIKELEEKNDRLKYKLLDTMKGGKIIEEETPQYIKENYIPTQKVKDILNEIQEEYNKLEEQFDCIWDKKSKDNYDRYKLQELSAMQQELGFILGKFEELLEEGE